MIQTVGGAVIEYADVVEDKILGWTGEVTGHCGDDVRVHFIEEDCELWMPRDRIRLLELLEDIS